MRILAFVDRATARQLGLGRHWPQVGAGDSHVADGATTLVLRLDQALRSRLRNHHKLHLVLRVTLTRADGTIVRLDRPVDAQKVTAWLNDLLARQGPDILRAKGILNVAGDERRLVFQAVHMILEGDFQRPWRAGEDRSSRMVFIGRNLDEALLRVGFNSCAA